MVPTQKLQWNTSSKVGSLANIKHKAGGGNVQIFDEKYKVTNANVTCTSSSSTTTAAGGSSSSRSASETRPTNNRQTTPVAMLSTADDATTTTTSLSSSRADKVDQVASNGSSTAHGKHYTAACTNGPSGDDSCTKTVTSASSSTGAPASKSLASASSTTCAGKNTSLVNTSSASSHAPPMPAARKASTDRTATGYK